MSYRQLDRQGFAAIETLLVLVIVAMVGGTGYYVYNANSKATDAQNAAHTAVNTAAPHTKKKGVEAAKPKLKYLTIKEWGVRIPYTGSDTYSYKLDNGGVSIEVISADLAARYGCKDFGAGIIARFKPDEAVYPDGGTTAAQSAASDPASWGHVGDYYYGYQHDQAACASADKVSDASAKAQNAANQAVSALVSKAEAIPQ